ncbi:ribonuclease activity regulator RraA [Lutimonas zeaxanthinifaciens]|uniref:ribonuclease activity regulator RraA n=1 Tax=Lutimonas zeaxanthinifaciens TaxID=3060215 RepID=UPI00265D20A5|nr:ribonuclease activity regulator RraA [Lutimonas sp. YSD2104]WKK66439.1 ribonuclease activity regulator RraA [Lutimonas sp. YSD2104]
MDYRLSKENRVKLENISTATITTALFKAGFKNQFIQDVVPLKIYGKNMIGQAYTLRYIPAREDRNRIEVFKNPEHPQRVAIESCPQGYVLVIDSRKNAKAASAGSILVTRLMKRGVSGIVTDGGFRDSSEIAQLPFSSFQKKSSAPTNLTWHEALDLNVPIGCGDVAVFPGDIIIGDTDGVVVIPQEIADDIINECIKMTLYEDFVMEKVKNGLSVIGLYPLTDKNLAKEFEKWKNRI